MNSPSLHPGFKVQTSKKHRQPNRLSLILKTKATNPLAQEGKGDLFFWLVVFSVLDL
jgi:hypothetical protein